MAILTSNARNHLRSAEFAVPESRSYPIPDETHARNALSRVSQYGSAHEQGQVRGAVHRKFPKIGSGKADVAHNSAKTDKHKSIGHRIMEIGRRTP